MKHLAISLVLLVLLALACNAEQAITPTTAPANTPMGQSERRCGDGICDRPENAENCPQDCTIEATQRVEEDGVHWVTNPTSGVQLYLTTPHK